MIDPCKSNIVLTIPYYLNFVHWSTLPLSKENMNLANWFILKTESFLVLDFMNWHPDVFAS